LRTRGGGGLARKAGALALKPFVLLGNPGSRRIAHFTNAIVTSGHPPPRVVAWLDLLQRGPAVLEALPDEQCVFRVESFGEDFEVERALLRRGFAAVRDREGPSRVEPEALDGLRFEPGRILAPRQVHEGFRLALADLAGVLARRPRWRTMTPLGSIAEMFDKRAASKALAALGVPVARRLPVPTTAAQLREQLLELRIAAAWVKLACGSSASCLALWELRKGRETLVTTMERTAHALYNSRRVRRYARRADVDHLVDFLLAEGAHVEEDVPRATLRGRWIDCRVVVVAGEREHVVVRASRYPMTNLHLGGSRADVSALAGRCPAEVLEAALATGRRIARHYGALHVGVDVAFTRGFRSHVVLEVNAFGDFLHGVTLGRDGLYAAEVRAAAALA
jgi:hypothetical protein